MAWSSEFPGLARTTYLNSCSHGLLPRRTKAAILSHLDAWEENPDWDLWARTVEEARRRFARLIGAAEDEVAVQANASTGIAAVMSTITEGTILTWDGDFPTAPFLAERQRARGLRHAHVRTNAQPLRLDDWRRHLGPDVALACLPAVASFTGQRLDARAYADAAHAEGVPLLLDAFQAAGTYPLDVHREDVDFLVTGTYKWLLGPVGLAFLYVKREHHARFPTTAGWHASRAPFAFDPMDDLAPDARRYQYGGASIVGAAAAAESLALIEAVGLDAIAAHNGRLVQRIDDEAQARGWEVLTPEDRASIVTFRVPDLAKALAACEREKIMINPRLGGIRASPHFYNDTSDIQRLFSALDKAA